MKAMRLRAFAGLFVLGSGLLLASCKHRDAASDAADARNNVAKLQSLDAGQRRDGAKDLAGEGPPPEAVGALLAAAQRENVPRALQAELLALGNSGAPEAEVVITTHLEDPDKSTRQAAQRAFKTWRQKNGQVVRREVVTQAAPAAGAPAAVDRAGDACSQFKDICAADPFAVDRCKADIASFDKARLETWADCVNNSSFGCQKAHDTCVAKMKSAP
jgi:HEAT repeat protein